MSEKTEGKGENSNSLQVKSEKMDGPPSPKRVKLAENGNDIKKINRDLLLAKFQEQDKYINHLEDKVNQTAPAGELTSLRESEEKLKLQQQESTRRENVLVMRLATKEQEMQELLTQIHDLKQAQNPAGAQLRSTLLDPAVNTVFQRIKSELNDTKEKLEQAQNDLSAWKFTPDSVTGKKLMAKCRMLIRENQELGRQLSQGRVAQLEAELALQKNFSEQLKNDQNELNEFVIQLDEEVEGMQSTILMLKQQLKATKADLAEEKQITVKHVEKINILERNLDSARTQPPSPVEGGKPSDIEEMRCDPADRTEVEPWSGHEEMQTESSSEGHGDDNMKGADVENVSGVYKDASSMVESTHRVVRSVLAEACSVYSDLKDVSPRIGNEEDDGSRVISVGENAMSAVEDVHFGDQTVQWGAENAKTNSENRNIITENAKMLSENANIIKANANLATENAKTTENANAFAENAKTFTETAVEMPPKALLPFGSTLDTNRKSGGTPPCSTTFSISQILGGEPKRTPSPDIPPGGDAIVTKIPYIGGYSEPTADGLRTEAILNGEGRGDASPHLIT